MAKPRLFVYKRECVNSYLRQSIIFSKENSCYFTVKVICFSWGGTLRYAKGSQKLTLKVR